MNMGGLSEEVDTSTPSLHKYLARRDIYTYASLDLGFSSGLNLGCKIIFHGYNVKAFFLKTFFFILPVWFRDEVARLGLGFSLRLGFGLNCETVQRSHSEFRPQISIFGSRIQGICN